MVIHLRHPFKAFALLVVVGMSTAETAHLSQEKVCQEDTDKVKIVEHFFSEDELKPFLEANLEASRDPKILFGFAPFPKDFVARLRANTGFSGVVDDKDHHEMSQSLRVKKMFKTTRLHQDHFVQGHRDPVQGDVAFAFLESNPDAHFQVGDTEVEAVAGRLVRFPGSTPHHTIIHKGSVAIVGPMDVVSLSPVGIDCEDLPCEHANCYFENSDSGKCALFQTCDGKVDMSHGDPTGVYGNACMGANSKLQMSGGQIIQGDLLVDSGVDLPGDIENRVQGIIDYDDFSHEKGAAKYISSILASKDCDETFTNLKIDKSKNWEIDCDYKNKDKPYVICVDELEFKSDVTLTPTCGNYHRRALYYGTCTCPVVFNIKKKFKVNQGIVTAAGGLSPSDVIYNVIGEGEDVAFSGGGGGLNCCKAMLEGTILAPDRKVKLSPGKVTGQVISGKDISLSSGSIVECPSPDCHY